MIKHTWDIWNEEDKKFLNEIEVDYLGSCQTMYPSNILTKTSEKIKQTNCSVFFYVLRRL